MKYTLLEITQDILNDLDSDEVNSISDTVESQQVAQIVKTCYFEMIANRNWPHLRKLIQLDNVSDVARPNYLKCPDRLKQLEFFRYDVSRQGQDQIVINEVKYKEPEAFLRLVSGRNSNSPDVSVVTDFGGSRLLIASNVGPTYWTSFDDKYIVTDSWDSVVDDTLVGSKTQCLAYIHPLWAGLDTSIPDLPEEAFPALVEEAKSTAFLALKQVANQKAEQKAGRQQRWLSRKAWAAHGGIDYPNYGRKRCR